MQLIRATRTTHVMCFTTQDLRAALIARRFVRFRAVWRSQGDLTISSREKPPDARSVRLIRSVRRFTDLTVTTTRWDAEALVRWGVPPERIRTVYLGVDGSWFERSPHPVIGEVRRIVISGRLIPWKGHLTFLRAFAQLASVFPGIEAWIAGEGAPDYRARLDQEVKDLGLTERVTFLGHQSDVRAILGQCEIAVHCSEREPFGLVLIEAMASGVPLVASDVEGPREIVDPGRTGLLVPPDDVEGFATALERLVRDPALRASIARNARAEALARFHTSANVAALDRLLFSDQPSGSASAPAVAGEGSAAL
jgi:glycosyltransferase involved in cell wall biosynthesis